MTALKRLWAEVVANPTVVSAALSQVLPLLVLLHIAWLTETEVALIGTLITAVLAAGVAFATHHPTYTVCLAVVQAAIGLGVAYGFTLSPKDIAILIGALGAVAHLLNWDRTTPKKPVPKTKSK